MNKLFIKTPARVSDFGSPVLIHSRSAPVDW